MLPGSRVSRSPEPPGLQRGDLSPALEEEQGLCVPSWSPGGVERGAGKEVGMWQEGGSSWLPGGLVHRRADLQVYKEAFSGGPSAAGGCPSGWAGTNPNSQQRKRPLWLAGNVARLEGGGQRCVAVAVAVAKEVARRCCSPLA